MENKIKLIAIFLVLLVCGTYIVTQRKNGTSNEEVSNQEIQEVSVNLRQMPVTKQFTTYTVDLSIDEDSNSFEGITQIAYTHEHERETDWIVLSARPMIIEDVQINSESVVFEQTQSAISIETPFRIQQDEEITITIQFRGRISSHDQKYNSIIAMCDFLPTIVAYDEISGWIRRNDTQLDSYRLVEPANYNVTVHTQQGRYPIATGIINDISESDGIITTTFSAKGVRNFGLMIGEQMEQEVINTEVGTSIVLNYPKEDDDWGKLVPMIKKSIANYSNIFGTYPYEQLTIVQSKDVSKGFTYPTMIVGNLYIQSPGYSDINQLVGQQWLYYIIGNSKEKESWLSKGLLEYVNMKFSLSKKQIETYIEDLRKLEEEDKRHAYEDDEIAMRMLYEIEQKIGEEKFTEALRAYYKNYSFQMATGKEFIQMVERVAEINVIDIYNYWVHKMELKESE